MNKTNVFKLDPTDDSEDITFKKMLGIVSPREGWDTYLLALAMVCVSAWIVREAEWVETPGLWIIMFLSTIVGLSTAKTKLFPWPISFILGILIGIIVAIWQTSRLIEDQNMLLAFREVIDHVIRWFEVARSDEINRDLIPPTLYLLVLAWSLGYVSTWVLFRFSNAWVGILLSGVAILTTLSFMPDYFIDRFYLFLIIAFIVVGRLTIVQRHDKWQANGILTKSRGLNTLISIPVVVAVSSIVLILANGIPVYEVGDRTIAKLWSKARRPLATGLENDFARMFSGITSKKNVAGRFFGDILPFQGKISFGGETVIWATSEEPTYWLSRTYSEYTSLGWKTGKTITSEVPVSDLPDEKMVDDLQLSYQMLQLGFDSKTAFIGGDITWINRPVVVETLAPREFEIDLKGENDSLPEDIKQYANNMKALLNPPPNKYVESFVIDNLPKDLLLVDITPGGQVQDWKTQNKLTVKRKELEKPDIVSWNFKDSIQKYEAYEMYSYIPDVTYNGLRNTDVQYNNYISDHYLYLPDTLPTRVKQLSLEITDGIEHPVDKALAIETFLRDTGGFTYSQDINQPPSDGDSVDWFLFDTKIGYSDYFASAMTVMMRAVDVPSRMAVGYASGELIEEGYRSVKDSDSHGWTQVYFPEYGWIDFEPTPKWDKLDRSFERKGISGVGESDLADLLLENNLSLDSIDEFIEPECSVENEFDFPFCEDNVLEDGAVDTPQPTSRDFPYPLVIAFAVIIGLPISIWLVWYLSLRGKSLAEKRYINMMRLATLGGISLKNTQTPIEYGISIGNLLPSIRESVSYITWDFSTTQYSGNSVQLSSLDSESEWKEIRKALLTRILSLRFITNKLG
ncbi:MAG: transglutaminase domain-containing protein [SAR202 cluster bacterium]|nr:transglutaminase domain-containing protein [SAR202 cluster bacterium]